MYRTSSRIRIRLLLPVFSSSRTVCWTGSKTAPNKQVRGWELAVPRGGIISLTGVAAVGNFPCLKVTAVTETAERHVWGCSLEQIDLIQNIKKGPVLLFVCFDPLLFMKE